VKSNDKIILTHSSTNKCLSVNEEHSNRYIKIKRIKFDFHFNSRSPYGREYELLCELSPGNLATYKAPIFWKFQTQSSY